MKGRGGVKSQVGDRDTSLPGRRQDVGVTVEFSTTIWSKVIETVKHYVNLNKLNTNKYCILYSYAESKKDDVDTDDYTYWMLNRGYREQAVLKQSRRKKFQEGDLV
ncbi:hypothetical protein STEG23_008001, partial [Scotinomys teguina]